MDKTATIKAGISIMYQPNLELILGPHIQDGILDGCFDSLPYGANRPRKNPQNEAVLARVVLMMRISSQVRSSGDEMV